MYEKTIGRNNLIYVVTLPTDLTRFVDCMEPADRDELLGILNVFRAERTVVDGYLKPDGFLYVAHKADGAEELVSTDERYPLPFYNWHEGLYIRGVGSVLARILTS